MSQTQIRLTRNPDINKVLAFLQSKYQLLSEADIIKMALSEKFQKERENIFELQKERRVKEAWEYVKKEGKKLGDKMMREKGLDPKKVSEQEFYNLFLDDHKHN